MKIILIFFLNNIINFSLNNGLEVFLIKNDIVPLVAIEIAFKAGSNYEDEITNGLFHLYEHMLFKGNRKYKTQKEFRERARELGINWNGSTSTERVQYYYVCPKENLYEAMDLLKEAIVYPLLDSTELEKEKTVVLDEYKRDFSYPLERFYHNLGKIFYGKDFVRKNVIGDSNAIKNATVEIMREIKSRFYNPENAFLVICGDIDIEDTRKMVYKIWGNWKNLKKQGSFYPVKSIRENKFIELYDKNIENAYMEVILKGPDTDNDRKATYVADLLSEIMNSENSFFKGFFIENGLAKNASFSYYTQRYGGEMSFHFETDKEKINSLREKFLEFMSKVDNPENYSLKEIEKAKRTLEIEMEKDREHPLDYALSISFFLCTADFEYYKNYVKEIKKIKKQDLLKFSKDYIKNSPFLMGIFVPEK